jgi:succinate-semialdehyde dehydrogenase / glutarate-semialdehyde dehydrogenase
MYINGDWIQTNKTVEVRHPGTKELFRTVYEVGERETIEAIEAADRAFSMWANLPAIERSNYLEKIASKINENREGLAKVISGEMGKPIVNARYEVDSAMSFFKWFAEEARRVYGETIPGSASNKRLMAIKQPVGIVGAITPWNFPLSMIARKLAPALAAGCTVVLRPSTQAPSSAIELIRIIHECEIPQGVVNLVIGNANEISKALLDSKKVRKITFTGSTEVGKKLMKGAADSVKRISMELGGHAPFIVFEDADIDLAVEGAIGIKFGSSGQQCVSANRIYIHNSIYEEFEQRFANKVSELRVGNGLDDTCNVGPLINENAIIKIQDQVDDAIQKGAKLLIGGNRLVDGEYAKGSYYSPTVLSKVDDSMKIVHEETFGPVAPLIPFSSEEEVIEKANNIEYGLAAYFYTKDIARVYRVTEGLEYGIVGVNDAAPFTVQGPFGGMKESGMGREGGHGIEDYVETKFVSIRI